MNNSKILDAISPPPSLQNMALSSIKRAILSGQMKPGIVYTEVAIAAHLGISRTPVREALISLASRGFLSLMPRKGFMIRALTEKEVKDLFTFREALETAVVSQVVPMLTDEIIYEIEEILFKHRKAAEEGNTLSSLEEDRAFHLHLAKITNNSFFINALEDVRDQVDLAGMRTLEIKDRMGESVAEHNAIASMMKIRSLTGAVAKMAEHIRTTENRVLLRIRAAQLTTRQPFSQVGFSSNPH